MNANMAISTPSHHRHHHDSHLGGDRVVSSLSPRRRTFIPMAAVVMVITMEVKGYNGSIDGDARWIWRRRRW
jgi:hypothetical protein